MRVVCTTCGKPFARHYNLVRHLKSVHGHSESKDHDSESEVGMQDSVSQIGSDLSETSTASPAGSEVSSTGSSSDRSEEREDAIESEEEDDVKQTRKDIFGTYMVSDSESDEDDCHFWMNLRSEAVANMQEHLDDKIEKTMQKECVGKKHATRMVAKNCYPQSPLIPTFFGKSSLILPISLPMN